VSVKSFMQSYGGRRLDQYEPPDPMRDNRGGEDAPPPDVVNLDVEVERDVWAAKGTLLHPRWRARDWAERPVRFIDGKDVGHTVACLHGPLGHFIPVRLSEIGSAVMRVENGECRREFATVERVVSMVASAFPWEEMESLAADLQRNELRLLPALPPDGQLTDVFEPMRKAAQNRSNDEMEVLEEVAVAQDAETPTIVDGRLERRSGGFDTERSPVFGVIKTHRQVYLHSRGLRLLYTLEEGERTPAFFIRPAEQMEKGDENGNSNADECGEAVRAGERTGAPPQTSGKEIKVRLPVVSWYVRLSGGGGVMPDWGLVRVEASLKWFVARGYSSPDAVNQSGAEFINQLSRTLYEYRCRERSYERAAVSLHPIVRAESSLRSLFSPGGMLKNSFYRLSGL
jgi:hypothetical protein